mmetsp:Transcript_10575/g.13755  ORF Transcript_10575/g.13755 Transcript_10575/m.13755 type:complete len:477 (-) Transcript_10575:81-1511(-)|eukprot:CAMPEP_0116062340 /NCGR_PEP_ID=MMETSP0322-20121206/7689_1 /TAXON_ID=163516 /ORGANISM="Leptocylindrus danicus var. apora, Strain B651" /LENGTH=476 /DNA_ID=CAMNT_0003547605 /DNA_START=88 /DNA_END=1518 /DNA_ORIENTATION=-
MSDLAITGKSPDSVALIDNPSMSSATWKGHLSPESLSVRDREKMLDSMDAVPSIDTIPRRRSMSMLDLSDIRAIGELGDAIFELEKSSSWDACTVNSSSTSTSHTGMRESSCRGIAMDQNPEDEDEEEEDYRDSTRLSSSAPSDRRSLNRGSPPSSTMLSIEEHNESSYPQPQTCDPSVSVPHFLFESPSDPSMIPRDSVADRNVKGVEKALSDVSFKERSHIPWDRSRNGNDMQDAFYGTKSVGNGNLNGMDERNPSRMKKSHSLLNFSRKLKSTMKSVDTKDGDTNFPSDRMLMKKAASIADFASTTSTSSTLSHASIAFAYPGGVIPPAPIRSSLKSQTSGSRAPSMSNAGGMRRNISFSKIHIREYDMTLGDNPCCSFGPPVQLSWDASHETQMCIEKYEETREPRRTKRQLVMSYCVRMQLLRYESRICRQELTTAIKEVRRIQKNRKKTKNMLVVQPVEELLESLFRRRK